MVRGGKANEPFSDGVEARLYRGNGGTNTAFWYTVTVDDGLFVDESACHLARFSDWSLNRSHCKLTVARA